MGILQDVSLRMLRAVGHMVLAFALVSFLNPKDYGKHLWDEFANAGKITDATPGYCQVPIPQIFSVDFSKEEAVTKWTLTKQILKARANDKGVLAERHAVLTAPEIGVNAPIAYLFRKDYWITNPVLKESFGEPKPREIRKCHEKETLAIPAKAKFTFVDENQAPRTETLEGEELAAIFWLSQT